MKSSTLWRFAALLVLTGLVAFSAPAQQDSTQSQGTDPVADAARKARADQKTAAKPKKVFTNDDIPAAAVTAPVASTTEKNAAQQPGDKTEKPDTDVKGETYWRGRFKDLHNKIAQTQQELDILQRELDKNQVQFYNNPQKTLMQEYDRSDINEKTGKIDAKKKELAALQQKQSDLEDDLRKAGGDPGWAR